MDYTCESVVWKREHRLYKLQEHKLYMFINYVCCNFRKFRWQKPLHSTIQWTELESTWCGCKAYDAPWKIEIRMYGPRRHWFIHWMKYFWSQKWREINNYEKKKKKKTSFRIEFWKSKVTWDKVLIFFGLIKQFSQKATILRGWHHP